MERKRGLSVYDLFNPVIYREVQNFFIKVFQAIPKLAGNAILKIKKKSLSKCSTSY